MERLVGDAISLLNDHDDGVNNKGIGEQRRPSGDSFFSPAERWDNGLLQEWGKRKSGREGIPFNDAPASPGLYPPADDDDDRISAATSAAKDAPEQDSTQISNESDLTVTGIEDTTTDLSSMMRDEEQEAVLDDTVLYDEDGTNANDDPLTDVKGNVRNNHAPVASLNTPLSWQQASRRLPEVHSLGTPPSWRGMSALSTTRATASSEKPDHYVATEVSSMNLSAQPEPQLTVESSDAMKAVASTMAASLASSFKNLADIEEFKPRSQSASSEGEQDSSSVAAITVATTTMATMTTITTPRPEMDERATSESSHLDKKNDAISKALQEYPGLACFPPHEFESILLRGSRCLLFSRLLSIKEGDRFLFQIIDPYVTAGQMKVVESR